MRSKIPMVLAIFLLTVAVTTLADDTPTAAPASPQAIAAKKEHAAAIRKAAEAYQNALIAADQKYIANLDTALKDAMAKQDVELVRSLDDQKRAAERMLHNRQTQSPAGRPTPDDFTWRRVDCPAPMMCPHLAVYDGKLYLIGGTLDGFNGSDAIWTYNLQSGEWNQDNATLPYPVWSLEPPLVLGSQALISPGFGPTRNQGIGQHNRLLGYDFAADQTGECAAYPGQNAIWGVALAAVTIDGSPRIYTFGGWTSNGGVNTICRYDLQNNKLVPVDSAVLNRGRHLLAIASDDVGRIVLFGASLLGGDPRVVEMFDARTETISFLGNILPADFREDGCNFAWCDGQEQFFAVHFDQNSAKACQLDLDTRTVVPATFSLPPRRFKTDNCRCTYDPATGQFYFLESKLENGAVTSDLWIGVPRAE